MDLVRKILIVIAVIISIIAVIIGGAVLLIAGILITPIFWVLGKRKFYHQPAQQQSEGTIDAEYEIIEPENKEIENEKSSD